MQERYTNDLHTPVEQRFLLHLLKKLGVPEHSGQWVVDPLKDLVTRAEVFKFEFKSKDALPFVLENEEIGLSPNEHIP